VDAPCSSRRCTCSGRRADTLHDRDRGSNGSMGYRVSRPRKSETGACGRSDDIPYFALCCRSAPLERAALLAEYPRVHGRVTLAQSVQLRHRASEPPRVVVNVLLGVSATFSCCSRYRARASALSEWRCARSDNVSRPCKRRNAPKGLRHAPRSRSISMRSFMANATFPNVSENLRPW